MKAKHPNPPYANGQTLGKIGDVILVSRDYDFDDNPLFYVNCEYPKYKQFDENNRNFVMDYEFYTDKVGNKYMVLGGTVEDAKKWAPTLVLKAIWDLARNVDEFVEGADKQDYERWLELIS